MPIRRIALVATLLAIMVLSGLVPGESSNGAEKSTGGVSTAPFGLQSRVPWTTSKVVGSPEPEDPFMISAAFPNLKFDRPLHLEIGPGGKRWFICQEQGLIYSIPTVGDVQKGDLFLDIRPKDHADPKWADRRRIWSMTFHPKFAENGYLYVCYLEYSPQPNRNRIVRYTVAPEARKAEVPVCDSATESLVIEWPAFEDHFGGCLVFGPDGYLYFSAGDGSGYADGNQTGQDISDLNASILRIDVDHAAPGKTYGIPADNPFINTPGARPEIFAYGLRNIWKFSIDQPTGNVWGCDVGQDLWESVILAKKGGNYGWSVTEGSHAFRENRKAGPTPILKPVWEHEHSEARSATGGFVYHGKRFPELSGKYVYGDYETGIVWALGFDGQKVTDHKRLVDTPLKLVGFGQDCDGELMLLDYQGTLHRFDRNPAAAKPDTTSRFPRKLSETGLFVSMKDLVPTPGVIPYAVNSPLWSDGAAKQRYFAVPGDQKVKYSTDNAWGFPDGSVLVKTFELEMEKGNPASRRRLETRIMHNEQSHWRGYTYVWNDEQTDAELLDSKGDDRTFDIKDASAPGGIRKQTWHFPSRAECTLCHTMPAGFVLGLRTMQMNRDYDYGGVQDNQVRALNHIGLFDQPVLAKHKIDGDASDPASFKKLPKVADPHDASASLNDRARAYLDSNCSHCHRKWGGGNALFELTFNLTLDKTKTVDVPPQHGEHGLKDARLISPGMPERSLILHRMKQLNETRMPRAGSSVVDQEGVELIEQWIRSLK